MHGRLIKNDIRKGKLIAITVTAFITVAAMLTSVAAILAVNLFGAIDHLMEEARATHFLQMHSGDIDERKLQDFADSQGNVDAYQLARFLNVDASEILIGENSLEGNVQDNAFSTQNELFDFLLDLDGEVVHPADGEVYVPLGYLKDGRAKEGDALSVRGVSLTVSGFLRDSAMNADLAGSKRFLVSDHDFRSLEPLGAMEYLIEFRLKDPGAFPAFQSEYFAAGLPSNGPPVISRPLLMMMNAITDGLMIAVLVLIAALVVLVAFLAIRFTLLAKIEEDYQEIGLLKAIGMRPAQLAKLYTAKYALIAGVACAMGFGASLPLSVPLMENIRLFAGDSGRGAIAPLIGALGAALIFLVVMAYVRVVLRRFRRISAAQAVRFGAPRDKSRAAKGFRLSRNRLLPRNVFLGVKDVLARKGLYVTMFLVLVVSAFILVVPQNIVSTVSARSFMTYLGVGESDVSILASQTRDDAVPRVAADVSAALDQDEEVTRFTVLSGMVFSMPGEDGAVQRLRVDLGDHAAFPVAYSQGGPPTTSAEIALSSLNADELGKAVGDELTLVVDGQDKRLTVCGIYSDITNAGKTAKAAFKAADGDLMRVVIPVELRDEAATARTASYYQEGFPSAQVAVTGEYVQQTFGATLGAIRKASAAAIAASAVLVILVTLLFMKLLVAKDRRSIAILKSLGFTSKDIRKQFMTRSLAVAALGVVVGVILADTVGELVGGALISSLGATTFRFVVDPLHAYVVAPLLVWACVYAATLLGTRDIRAVKISAHIKEA